MIKEINQNKEIYTQNNKRDPFWDFVKGIAIILVLIGHSIQYGSSYDYSVELQYLENPLFKVIYGFHMPLFMFVSGYLFSFSVEKRDFLHTIIHLLHTLFIPLLMFHFIGALIIGHDWSLMGIIRCTYESLGTLWFLWAVMFAMIATHFINQYVNNRWWIHLVLIVILYILPDLYQTALWKFVYPFFILGFYCRSNNFIDILMRNKRQVVVILTPIYLFLIAFVMNKNIYVYFTKVSLYSASNILYQLYYDITRLVIGLLGVMAFLCIIRIVFEKYERLLITKSISFLGVNSMGIYCFQDLFNLKVFKIFPPPPIPIENTPILYFIVLTVLSVLCSVVCSKILPLRIILLGGRK